MAVNNNSVPRFPPPPAFYKTFLTDEDIQREPPKPPNNEKEIFNIFGKQWGVEDELPVNSTYNESLQSNFKQLQKAMQKVLETLESTEKDGYMDDVEQINKYFSKIQALLKSYRYHEARANIVTHLEQQVQRKEDSIEELDQTIADIKQKLERCLS